MHKLAKVKVISGWGKKKEATDNIRTWKKITTEWKLKRV
jgi:hypothetical protein